MGWNRQIVFSLSKVFTFQSVFVFHCNIARILPASLTFMGAKSKLLTRNVNSHFFDIFYLTTPSWFSKWHSITQGKSRFLTFKKIMSAGWSALGTTQSKWPIFLHSDLRAKFKKRHFFHRKNTPTGTSNPPRHLDHAFKG